MQVLVAGPGSIAGVAVASAKFVARRPRSLLGAAWGAAAIRVARGGDLYGVPMGRTNANRLDDGEGRRTAGARGRSCGRQTRKS